MRLNIKNLFTIVVVILLGHIAAIVTGLYANGVNVDKLLHILGGIFFGIIWILILQKCFKDDSRGIKVISIILFSLLGGFIWEIFEVILTIYFYDIALTLKIWSSTVSDALLDMAYGILGATFLSYLYYKKHK